MTGWLDMSVYPEADPDTVLTGDQTHLLRTLLTQPVSDVPAELWQRMLDVTWSTVAESDTGTDGDIDDPSTLASADVGADADLPAEVVVTEWTGSHTSGHVLDDGMDQDLPDDTGDDAW